MEFPIRIITQVFMHVGGKPRTQDQDPFGSGPGNINLTAALQEIVFPVPDGMGPGLVLEKTIPVAVAFIRIHILLIDVVDQGIIPRVSVGFDESVPYQGVFIQGFPDHLPVNIQFTIFQVVYDGCEFLVLERLRTSFFHKGLEKYPILLRELRETDDGVQSVHSYESVTGNNLNLVPGFPAG
jgi:hypothetical protein